MSKLKISAVFIILSITILFVCKRKGIYNIFILPTVNYFSAQNAQLDSVYLEFKSADWNKIKSKRDSILKNGYYESKKEDYVNLKITFSDSSYNAKARLKGDLLDHFEGTRWSLKVKMGKGKKFNGFRRFSLQDPKTRRYIHEWIFQQLLIQEDLLGVYYDFLSVQINDENKGVYAFEEAFNKNYIKIRGLKNSYVFRFDESIYWQDYFSNKENFMSYDNKMFSKAKIKPYTNFHKDSSGYNQFKLDSLIIEDIKSNKCSFEQYFDIYKWAKYMALIDLVGGAHGFRWNNVRFLKNSLSMLIEPVGYDANAGSVLKNLLVNEKEVFPKTQADFFFTPKVKALYFKELSRLSKKEYLDTFFEKIDVPLQNKLSCIYINNPEYVYEQQIYYLNQQFISEQLKIITLSD